MKKKINFIKNHSITRNANTPTIYFTLPPTNFIDLHFILLNNFLIPTVISTQCLHTNTKTIDGAVLYKTNIVIVTVLMNIKRFLLCARFITTSPTSTHLISYSNVIQKKRNRVLLVIFNAH